MHSRAVARRGEGGETLPGGSMTIKASTQAGAHMEGQGQHHVWVSLSRNCACTTCTWSEPSTIMCRTAHDLNHPPTHRVLHVREKRCGIVVVGVLRPKGGRGGKGRLQPRQQRCRQGLPQHPHQRGPRGGVGGRHKQRRGGGSCHAKGSWGLELGLGLGWGRGRRRSWAGAWVSGGGWGCGGLEGRAGCCCCGDSGSGGG